MIVDKNAPLGAHARREFFLWAIFLDRFELGKYLCSKTWVIFPFIATLIRSKSCLESIGCSFNCCSNLSFSHNSSPSFQRPRTIREQCQVSHHTISRAWKRKFFLCSQFDKYAMSIIDRCFHNDEEFAVDLLKQPAVMFDNVQPLELAEEAECRAFLASECVQRYLDYKWSFHIVSNWQFSFNSALDLSGLAILIIKFSPFTYE